jgi:hypothetical protein
MDQKNWITKANKMLKEYPGMSKDEVIKTLKDQGFARPTGIEGRDSRSFKKKTRSSSGRARRKAQEKVSTETSAKNTKLQRQLIAEDLGIAEYSGLEKPFFEHTYSQDVSGLLEEGAPGDYVERLPTQDSAFKTEAERISRQNYKNRFAILTTPEGFRAVPREYFSELADPSTLPGIDLDPNVSIKEQFSKYTSSFNFNKGSARFNRNLSKFGKGASKFIPGSFDDVIIGGVLATGAAGATLLTGGSPAQAGEAFLETGVDVATGDLQGGNLADATLQTNLDKVKNTLYQEPVNIAAPTGVTTFDAVAQPLIKGLAGQPMDLKRNKGSIIFGF